MKWLIGRGPVSEPVDSVQLAINHAGNVAMLMTYLHDLPGWTTTAPKDLYDLAQWLIVSRRHYQDGGKWAGSMDRTSEEAGR